MLFSELNDSKILRRVLCIYATYMYIYSQCIYVKLCSYCEGRGISFGVYIIKLFTRPLFPPSPLILIPLLFSSPSSPPSPLILIFSPLPFHGLFSPFPFSITSPFLPSYSPCPLLSHSRPTPFSIALPCSIPILSSIVSPLIHLSLFSPFPALCPFL